MRSASAGLIAALAGGTPLWSADLYTITLANTLVYRWTSADQDINAGGHLFSAGGPAIDRASWSAKNTTEVPELAITLYSTGQDFGATNFKADLHAGLFDGAYIQLDRAFMPAFGDTSLGTVVLFGGRAGKIELTAVGATITCTASNVLLTQNMPRRTYQATCMHTLYDTGCTLSRASFTASFIVDSATATAIAWTAAPGDPSVYLFGTLTMTSGAGIGQAMTVANYASTGLGFAYPLVIVPAPGDTFDVSQGCAKTMARCQVFGNIANYGGFPYIPAATIGL